MTALYLTPCGYHWSCQHPECMKERDDFGDVEENELFHCKTSNCHTVVWTEKGLMYDNCHNWFCACCWQKSGIFSDGEGIIIDNVGNEYEGDWYCNQCVNTNHLTVRHDDED